VAEVEEVHSKTLHLLNQVQPIEVEVVEVLVMEDYKLVVVVKV
jgi:hypothetical protein